MRDPLDVIAEICHDQPHDALEKIAQALGFKEPPQQFPYDRTFRAIQAATRIEGGGAIGVSVKAFIKAWNAYGVKGLDDGR